MSSIHQSHSRKELSEITEIFNLNVTNYNKLNKKDLAKSLLYQLSTISEIKEDNDYYFVKNKQELLDYLINPDCSKNLTVKEKDKRKQELGKQYQKTLLNLEHLFVS